MKKLVQLTLIVFLLYSLLALPVIASSGPTSTEFISSPTTSDDITDTYTSDKYERENLFWNAFGAIGGTIGALATAGAVVVALWQTKFSQKKKLKVSIKDDIAVVPDGGNVIYRYIGVSVVNIGNRDVILSSWGFELSNGQCILIVPDTSRIGKVVSVVLPYKLSLEEEKTLMYAEPLFFTVVRERVASGDLKKDQRIKFYVIDSTGKKYTALTTKTVNEYLEIADKREK